MPSFNLDRLPAWLRHDLLIFWGAVIGVLAPDLLSAMQTCSGTLVCIGGPDWVTELAKAGSAGLVAVLGIGGALAGTTLTRQYGVGAAGFNGSRSDGEHLS